jgi:pyridoxine kinase
MAIHVLSVSSQVAYGPVGNSAAVPAMEALGLVVHPVPTVILSNHPGHGAPAGFRAEARHIGAILGALENLGVLARCAAVLTGYFAANDQVHAVAHAIRRMKVAAPGLYYLCDPVLGDDPNGLYVPAAVAGAIRDELLPLADCVAPNRFELAFLSGQAVTSLDSAVAAARALACPEILATSIPAGNDRLATLAVTPDGLSEHRSPRLDRIPHGTGDMLAGLYLAHRAKGAPPSSALTGAMAILERVIAASAGSTVLNLADGLK